MGEPIVITPPVRVRGGRGAAGGALRLRDHLRANPGTAREYAALKRELAAAYGDDRAGYTEAKTAFIEAALAGG